MPHYVSPPTLGAFLESDAFVRIVKGPFGSGKSSGCVMELAKRAREQEAGPDGIRRTKFAVVRNTYRELEDTTRQTFEQWLGGYGRWDEKNFTFEMRTKGVESDILFRALDKPSDVKKLLSLEITGAYLNELREIGKQIFDGVQGRVGRYPSKKDGVGATWSGVWADTNPWHTGHWGHKLFAKPAKDFKKRPIEGVPRRGIQLVHDLGAVFELYTQPGGRDGDAENLENLPDGYYPRMCAGKDKEWIEVYVDGSDARTDKGSIFGVPLEAVPVEAFEHPHDQVFTTWDLGRADATSIWFWIIHQGRVEVIDHYEASGEGAAHYFGVIEGKPYQYAKHWLPHDARAMTLATEVSFLNQCIKKFGAKKVAIVPRLSLEDGISAARWLLERPIRFHARCDDAGENPYSGLEALREYKYEWDDKNQCFSKDPLHNWASHTADAFRYLAIVAKVSERLGERRKATPPPAPTRPGPHTELSLDELFEGRGGSGRGGPSRV